MDKNYFSLDNDIGFLIQRALQSVKSNFYEKFSKYGLTTKQYGVLIRLWEEDGLPQKELGSRLYTDGATITGIIDRMERESLVVRKKDGNDRRLTKVYLTIKGHKLKNELKQEIFELNKIILEKLTHEEVRQLKRLIKKLS
ncbi:MAG: MarR family transcriptional regulator [Thermodesulfobacteriota bacterium]|nr:MarR family transcriptional regulator [Thermodesulfobacteriota bacterium]